MASSSTLPQVQFTGPTKIVGYTPFGGPHPQPALQLYAWEGPPGGVAVLTPEGYSDPAAMSNIVNWLSSAYQFYFTVTGHVPAHNIEVDGRDSIALLPPGAGDTTTAGLGYLGATGIEVQNTWGQLLYNDALQGRADQVAFYELGRNFWFYGDQLGALAPPGAVDSFVTGFAVANRWHSGDYAGVSFGLYNGVTDATQLRQQTMGDLLKDYLADPNASWQVDLSGGANDGLQGNIQGVNFGASKADLAGSFYYKIFSDWGTNGYAAFWHDMASEPKAATADQVKGDFLDAAKKATGEDYSFLFKNRGVKIDYPVAPHTNNFFVVDTSTGQDLSGDGDPYSGPVVGVQRQYIKITPDSLNITAQIPNVFIHSGAGTDALDISAAGGERNVLDGSLGSNFLVGSNSPTSQDTFFVDDRQASADIWSTMANFHKGDDATVWGVTLKDFQLSWADFQGAEGFKGLTLHAVPNQGGPIASATLSGYTSADLSNGRLEVTFGNVQGNDYMQIATMTGGEL